MTATSRWWWCRPTPTSGLASTKTCGRTAPRSTSTAFDDAVTGNAGALIALGKAFADETDPETDRGAVFRRNWQTEGHHDITARLRDMDYDGIAAEVIFHGSQNSEIIPFQAARAFFGELPDDLELAAVGLHIYNSWLADYCSHEPARHVGLVHLPWWDLDAAIAELQWAREAGLRSVNFPAPRAFLPPYNSREWEPFWSACADLDMPLTTHAGAGDPSSWSGPETVCLLSLESGGWPARRAMHFMILGGVFERHPNLRLVLTEQPGDWWTSSVNDLDSTYLASIHTPASPSRHRVGRASTARENVFIGASFLARYEAEHAVRDGYTSQVMWGSDYPHMEGTFQYPRSFDEPSVGRMAMRYTFAGLARRRDPRHGRRERGAGLRPRPRRAGEGRGPYRCADAHRARHPARGRPRRRAARRPSAPSAPGASGAKGSLPNWSTSAKVTRRTLSDPEIRRTSALRGCGCATRRRVRACSHV